jgi:hypothetical protein
LIGKHRGAKKLGISQNEWEDNIKMYLTEIERVNYLLKWYRIGPNE